jgi:hypothetical protein
MASQRDVSAQFQRRRRATWRQVRWWLLIALLATGAFGISRYATDRDPAYFPFQLLMFVILAFAMIVVFRTVDKAYRCPACNAVPMVGSFEAGPAGFGYDEGISLNPRTCRKCGAKLR